MTEKTESSPRNDEGQQIATGITANRVVPLEEWKTWPDSNTITKWLSSLIALETTAVAIFATYYQTHPIPWELWELGNVLVQILIIHAVAFLGHTLARMIWSPWWGESTGWWWQEPLNVAIGALIIVSMTYIWIIFPIAVYFHGDSGTRERILGFFLLPWIIGGGYWFVVIVVLRLRRHLRDARFGIVLRPPLVPALAGFLSGGAIFFLAVYGGHWANDHLDLFRDYFQPHPVVSSESSGEICVQLDGYAGSFPGCFSIHLDRLSDTRTEVMATIDGIDNIPSLLGKPRHDTDGQISVITLSSGRHLVRLEKRFIPAHRTRYYLEIRYGRDSVYLFPIDISKMPRSTRRLERH